MFEIPSLITEQPRLYVVSHAARDVTREVLQLWQQVIEAPGGMTYIEAKNSIERRITHAGDRDVTLQAVRSYTAISEDNPQTTVFAQLGVLDGSGHMFFSLEPRRATDYDFRDDPFIELVIGYFRSHAQACQAA